MTLKRDSNFEGRWKWIPKGA